MNLDRYTLYGNTGLLKPDRKRGTLELCRKPSDEGLRQAELYAETLVLDGGILVSSACGPLYQRMSTVPLRWGAPRILVFNGTLEDWLGADLKEEPFRAARLWRYRWDSKTDLAIAIGGRCDYNYVCAELRDTIYSIAGKVAVYDPEWNLAIA